MPFSDVNYIARTLATHGFRAWLVGGAVRDMLIGLETTDMDVATDAKPNDVARIFKDAIPTGERFGTMTVLLDKRPYQVTTLRTEGDYVGHHPQSVQFGASLQDDLARRDFTVNAMAIKLPVDPARTLANLEDYHGGLEDIRASTIRAVGDPIDRFNEDPLRMLRAARLAADLNFRLDQGTFDALSVNAESIGTVSKERIRQELERILLPRRGCPSIALDLMQKTGLLAIVSPALNAMVSVEQDRRWHAHDVWQHTLWVVDYVPARLDLRLAALYHDAGKPVTRSVDEDGYIHFYGHEDHSAQIAKEDLIRLTFPTKLAHKVALLCKEHMFSVEMGAKAIRRLQLRLDADNTTANSLLFDSLVELRRADVFGSDKTELIPERIAELEEFVKRAEEAIQSMYDPKQNGFELAINGFDIMQRLGIDSGPKVGQIKQELLDWVLEDPARNMRDTLMKRLPVIVREKVVRQ